ILHLELHFLTHHPDSANRQDDGNREDGVPLLLAVALKVAEHVLPLALKLNVVGLVGFERRKHHKTEGAAGLQNRTMSGVLRQHWARALATRRLSDSRPAGVWKQTNFHRAVIL